MRTQSVRYLSSPPGCGAWNMALDEALMAGAWTGLITLRLYGWRPACLSFGRNQVARDRYDPQKAKRRGIDLVRRPTGGRAVLHRREITYSVTAPAGIWGGLSETYGRINRGLARGLRSLGVPLDSPPSAGEPGHAARGRDGGGRAPAPLARACFRDPLPGELTSGGAKLVGSAQRRVGGAVLQHGSILLHDDQRLVDELLRDPKAAALPSGACSIHGLLGFVPSVDELHAALSRGFAEAFGLPLDPADPTPAERRAAEALQSRYRDPAWTWRR